ncbi:transposase domain-containing protein [Streptomyces sp. NPDC046931]|uniref:transposase domain-containing protein n=1 Tax=Streptomyces sp. NPDC046931 TaxID=3154806 RepID=UPI0033C7D4E9
MGLFVRGSPNEQPCSPGTGDRRKRWPRLPPITGRHRSTDLTQLLTWSQWNSSYHAVGSTQRSPGRRGLRGPIPERRRLLSAWLVVYFVLTLCLFARESCEEVLRVLSSSVPGSRALARVNRSSPCRARARLGQDVPGTNVFTETGANRAGPPCPARHR